MCLTKPESVTFRSSFVTLSDVILELLVLGHFQATGSRALTGTARDETHL